MKTAYICLGSNLSSRFGDRAANLKEALRRLAFDRVWVDRTSQIWETAPQDVLDQPMFLNQVAEVRTTLMPLQLLNYVKRIEREMGRDQEQARLQPKGPRVIDLDILFYGKAIVSSPGLEIPHPSLQERKFVLGPLAELAPDLRHPVLGRTVREMLNGVSSQQGHPI